MFFSEQYESYPHINECQHKMWDKYPSLRGFAYENERLPLWTNLTRTEIVQNRDIGVTQTAGKMTHDVCSV